MKIACIYCSQHLGMCGEALGVQKASMVSQEQVEQVELAASVSYGMHICNRIHNHC
jgi:hypothetical protein